MESDPASNLMMRHLMRKAILDALHPPVKTELDKDHRIGIMPRSEFRDAVTYFVILQRRAEENMSKQDTKRQRKLVQTQLDNAKGQKKTVQAPVIEATVQSLPAPAPTASPATSALTQAAPQAPQPMRPEYAYEPPPPPQPYWVQPYPQWQQPPQPWGAQTPVNRNRGGGRGRGGNNGARGNANGPLVCWTCQQEGHRARDCGDYRILRTSARHHFLLQ